jgi:Flp pilus assembly protein TadG
MSITMAPTVKSRIRARLSAAGFSKDRSGIAATEFAVIVPIMLVMFFGTVEFSTAMAVDRNVSLMARALANLTSQSAFVTDIDLANFYSASNLIMAPYVPTAGYPATNQTITELYIDPTTGNARVQWSRGTSPHTLSSIIPIPSSLIARDPTTNAILSNQYVLLSEVNVLYTPAVGYVMKSSVTLSEVAYAIPRVSTCVFYPSTPSPATCPTS